MRGALRDIESSGLFNEFGYRHDQINRFQGMHSVSGEGSIAVEKEKNVGNMGAFRLLYETEITHKALLEYLDIRKIDRQIAKYYLTQIHFEPSNGVKQFFALGWKSSQGYEARNSLFKGFVGSGKGVTYLKADKSAVCFVFEGFMDYLSYLSDKKISKPDFSVIVLNSGVLKIHALPHIIKGGYKQVNLFMDNDDMGNECFKFFQCSLKSVELIDMRSEYEGYKDYNAMVMSK